MGEKQKTQKMHFIARQLFPFSKNVLAKFFLVFFLGYGLRLRICFSFLRLEVLFELFMVYLWLDSWHAVVREGGGRNGDTIHVLAVHLIMDGGLVFSSDWTRVQIWRMYLSRRQKTSQQKLADSKRNKNIFPDEHYRQEILNIKCVSLIS